MNLTLRISDTCEKMRMFGFDFKNLSPSTRNVLWGICGAILGALLSSYVTYHFSILENAEVKKTESLIANLQKIQDTSAEFFNEFTLISDSYQNASPDEVNYAQFQTLLPKINNQFFQADAVKSFLEKENVVLVENYQNELTELKANIVSADNPIKFKYVLQSLHDTYKAKEEFIDAAILNSGLN